ncbi:hypothetical protein QJQ45_024467, partial [Haematococcus lacustris]
GREEQGQAEQPLAPPLAAGSTAAAGGKDGLGLRSFQLATLSPPSEVAAAPGPYQRCADLLFKAMNAGKLSSRQAVQEAGALLGQQGKSGGAGGGLDLMDGLEEGPAAGGQQGQGGTGEGEGAAAAAAGGGEGGAVALVEEKAAAAGGGEEERKGEVESEGAGGKQGTEADGKGGAGAGSLQLLPPPVGPGARAGQAAGQQQAGGPSLVAASLELPPADDLPDWWNCWCDEALLRAAVHAGLPPGAPASVKPPAAQRLLQHHPAWRRLLQLDPELDPHKEVAAVLSQHVAVVQAPVLGGSEAAAGPPPTEVQHSLRATGHRVNPKQWQPKSSDSPIPARVRFTDQGGLRPSSLLVETVIDIAYVWVPDPEHASRDQWGCVRKTAVLMKYRGYVADLTAWLPFDKAQRLRNISPVFAAAKDRLAATLAADVAAYQQLQERRSQELQAAAASGSGEGPHTPRLPQGHGDAQLLLQGWAASSEAAEAVAKTRPYRYGTLQWPLLVDAVSKRLRVVLQSTLSGQVPELLRVLHSQRSEGARAPAAAKTGAGGPSSGPGVNRIKGPLPNQGAAPAAGSDVAPATCQASKRSLTGQHSGDVDAHALKRPRPGSGPATSDSVIECGDDAEYAGEDRNGEAGDVPVAAAGGGAAATGRPCVVAPPTPGDIKALVAAQKQKAAAGMKAAAAKQQSEATAGSAAPVAASHPSGTKRSNSAVEAEAGAGGACGTGGGAMAKRAKKKAASAAAVAASAAAAGGKGPGTHLSSPVSIVAATAATPAAPAAPVADSGAKGPGGNSSSKATRTPSSGSKPIESFFTRKPLALAASRPASSEKPKAAAGGQGGEREGPRGRGEGEGGGVTGVSGAGDDAITIDD